MSEKEPTTGDLFDNLTKALRDLQGRVYEWEVREVVESILKHW